MKADETESPLIVHAGRDEDTVSAAVGSMDIPASPVRSVGGKAAAVEAVAERDVSCLICEAQLADGTGLDLLTEIEAAQSAPRTLFVTDDPSLGTDALEAGATDIFVRHDGIDPVPGLARRLRNVLARRGATRHESDEAVGALLSSMYDVTTDRASTYEEKVDRLLTLGCETFGLENGFVTRIESGEGDGQQIIVQSRGPHEKLQPGESCPLSEAYCRKTIETDGLLAFSNAIQAGWEGDPGYEAFDLGCYIGGKIVVDGTLYGTLCFSASEPREAPFTELERTAVRLMSEWVSYELEQRRNRAELEMKNRAMDEAPVGILISDPDRPDNPAVYVNDKFTEMTGYPESAVLGRNCRFLQGERTRAEPVDTLRAAIEDERPASVELRNYRRDGSEFWNRVTVAPIEDESGAIRSYVGFQEDITERKERELDLKLRNRAISAAPIGITIHDATGDPWPVTFANDGFEAVTGYDAATICDSGIAELTGPETDADRFGALEAAFERGESASEVVLLYRQDDAPFWGRVSIAPVTDESGAVTHFVGFLQDVTDTKEHAETIERRLDEFGDVLAAELRTPLQEARSRLTGDPASVSRDDIEAALDAVEQTDGLIDDLTTVHSFTVKPRDVFESADRRREEDA